MIKRIIIFLIRKRLGLKKFQGFKFVNQKSEDDWYVFTDEKLLKVVDGKHVQESNIRLNWILDNQCICLIRKINVKFEK